MEAGTELWSQHCLIRCSVLIKRTRDVAQRGAFYSLPAMWAIRSQTRLLYPNSLSYLLGGGGNKENGSTHWKQIFECHKWERPIPCDQLDEVVVEGDTSASVKDGGVAVAVEVCGHNLRGDKGQIPETAGLANLKRKT